MTSKGPNTGADTYIQKKIDPRIHEYQDTLMGFARIASGVNSLDYYNPKSHIVAVQSGENTVWAHLVGNAEFPDPDKHDLLWIRSRKTEQAPDNAPIPDEFPDHMGTSLAFLVPRQTEPVMSASTSTSALSAGFIQDNQDRVINYPGRMENVEAPDRTGLTMGLDSGHVLLKGPGSEIAMTEKGTQIDGPIINQDMEKKGLFSQNPLSFLIPETIVSFPASMKFLPDLKTLESIGMAINGISALRQMISAFKKL